MHRVDELLQVPVSGGSGSLHRHFSRQDLTVRRPAVVARESLRRELLLRVRYRRRTVGVRVTHYWMRFTKPPTLMALAASENARTASPPLSTCPVAIGIGAEKAGML